MNRKMQALAPPARCGGRTSSGCSLTSSRARAFGAKKREAHAFEQSIPEIETAVRLKYLPDPTINIVCRAERVPGDGARTLR